MVFVLSLINSVYNLGRFCPKQDIKCHTSLVLIINSVLHAGLMNFVCTSRIQKQRLEHEFAQFELPINEFKARWCKFYPLF